MQRPVCPRIEIGRGKQTFHNHGRNQDDDDVNQVVQNQNSCQQMARGAVGIGTLNEFDDALSSRRLFRLHLGFQIQ